MQRAAALRSRRDPDLRADVRFGIVVDDPAVPSTAREALLRLHAGMLGRLRLRWVGV